MASILVGGEVSQTQGFFSRSRFFTRNHRKNGYREISEIPPIYRTNFFKQILNSNFFTAKQIKFVYLLLLATFLKET
jgi:hypothetical protein